MAPPPESTRSANRSAAVSRGPLLLVGLSILVLVGVAVYGLVGVPAITGVTDTDVAPGTGTVTEVDGCTTLSEPGHYVLVTDLESETDRCLEVVADDVVVDGDGHRIRGGSRLVQGSVAVAVGPAEDEGTLRNVTVRNLSVVNWVFGVVYDSVDGGAIVDTSTYQTVDGVTVRDSTDVSIENTRIRNGCVGVCVVRSDRVELSNTTLRWFTTTGVSVVDSRTVTVSNVTVSETDVGIALYQSEDIHLDDVNVTNAEGGGVVVTRPEQVPCDRRGEDRCARSSRAAAREY